MRKALAKLTHFSADILVKVAAAGLVAMTLIAGWQVFGRYVLNSSPSWSEQAALTLMIWYVSLAAAAGVREGFHIRIVVLENNLGPSARRILRIINDGIVALCGLAMAIWGSELVMRTWEHTIPSLGISRGLAYAGLPIAGGLIVLFALERILEAVDGAQIEDEEDPRWN